MEANDCFPDGIPTPLPENVPRLPWDVAPALFAPVALPHLSLPGSLSFVET